MTSSALILRLPPAFDASLRDRLSGLLSEYGLVAIQEDAVTESRVWIVHFTDASGRDAAATTLNLPWGVRLDSVELTGWPALDARGGGMRAATLTAEGAADHPFGYWMTIDGDSIEIGYPAGARRSTSPPPAG